MASDTVRVNAGLRASALALCSLAHLAARRFWRNHVAAFAGPMPKPLPKPPAKPADPRTGERA